MDVARRQLIYVTRDPSETLCARFEERGWHIEIVSSARETRKALRQDMAIGGLLDLSSHFESHELAAFESSLTMTNVGWVAATVSGQLEDAAVRRLIRDYCFDYVTLPTSNDRIVDSVGHAYGMVSLHDAASHDARSEGRAEGEMVGSCDAMLALFRSIRKVAMTDAPVFISGESAPGKELTAVAIHERSARRDQPFVAINCGAVPPHLLQSELFGYERGAFTGANQRKIGRVEAANGGTLFLDEIGDLPLESQASLLRFLQERKVERLGGHGSIEVDVRIICATHLDIQTAMIERRFRADFYHPLCVLRVDEPPLRARGKDIEILAHHILHKFKTDSARKIRGFTPSAIEALYNYNWPGNVRELINRVRRAIVMAETKLISAEDLDLANYSAQQTMSLAQAREAAEKRAIESALLRHRHRLNEAAADLGISRVTLYRLMGSHGLRDLTSSDDKGAVPGESDVRE